MSQEFALLIALFVALLCLRVPIAFVLGMVTVVTSVALDYDHIPLAAASDLSNGIDSFALLAIPFFILAGELMGCGGLARRLIDLATAVVGRLPGGLAAVNTLTCMLFGAISGSSVAAVSSIGGTLIPEMNRKGYDKDFNIALTACAATTGLLIPPSNIMIVYALVAGNVSVAALFLAGVVPGVVVGLGIMSVALVLCLKRGYGKAIDGVAVSYPPFMPSLLGALPSLLLVVIVLGGILGGVFTATEASAIAVLWAFILGVGCYREIAFSELPRIILKAARTTAVVLFLVACSYAMSRLLTQEQVPQQVSAGLLSLSENPIVILIIMNLVLLMVGVFMDMTPAVLIFTPIFLPIATALGLDPVHFGIILIANLCIGLLTPPVGTCLFVGAGVGKSDIVSVSKAMLPFYVVMVLALLLITYWAPLSMFLPNLAGV
ncbi:MULTISPECIES: TRAP transporter large permease [unclassified Lentimonas]|uniref:TRAP transporter large permease n=1 Tax=unclassified Lentimonas TaxID=2630993 RepID=UPI00132B0C1C|nr:MULTISPECIES: TRAP transporter large permease [unclassified Lentimonas]CAA6676326.1 TRAP-type C4-dicarboxylate transport system, large permease component [Lentimonas sp. CC4]CAA6683784.1 TRAP-type C4-dicarboxylate transport system, large permease component [Lentimonas sp. CC6]CAA6696464.1 TRAP-type C4-dicarboxylate transport system, large permease component [Lentimonas sp. CC19]CAA6697666.1 TRAP-type C4-dicarboxylate transport system, large permease component [Lentimonas sp. CC10]CAA7072481